VPTGGRVLFVHLRNLSRWKSLRDSYQRWPKSSVNESHLSIQKTANKHIFRISYRLKDGEYVVAFRMRPPASSNRLVDDSFREAWNRALRRCKNHTVFFDERDRFVGGHISPRYAQRLS
jgi:hypothetical protein